MLFECLDFELKNKERVYSKLKGQYNKELVQFKSLATWLDFKVFISK